MSVKLFTRHCVALLSAVALLVGYSANASALTGVTFTPGEAITQTGIFKTGISPITVECPITLSGSFASGLTAIRGGEVVGAITGWNTGTCTRGSIISVLNIPSPLRLMAPASTNPAGSVSSLQLSSNVGIRVRLSTGGECLIPAFTSNFMLEALGDNEYEVRRSLDGGLCGGSTPALVEMSAPTPAQVATFLVGNEVIDGFTPRPLVFKTVRAGALAQRTVTIGSVAGGRIEEIVVTSQRYFAITDPNGCRGRTLAARGTCDINVLLSAPAEAGRVVTDTLTVRIAERRFEGTLRAST